MASSVFPYMSCALYVQTNLSNSNILSLPFRRTASVSLSEAIKQYISTKYDQHPDMFAQDLEEIDRLRSSAIHSTEPHISGIKKLQAYAAQLVWISGKFPIDVCSPFQNIRVIPGEHKAH